MIKKYYLRTENGDKVHIRNIDRLMEGHDVYLNLTPEIDGKIVLYPFELSDEIFSKGICAKCGKTLFEHIVLRNITSVYTETYGCNAEYLTDDLCYVILDDIDKIHLDKKSRMICSECYYQ